MINIKNPNHPKKGQSVFVEPIRLKKDVANIKKYIKDQPRNTLLFIFGINTGYRANEILSLKVKDVKYLTVGDVLRIYQKKTGKYRSCTINKPVYNAIVNWLCVCDLDDDDPLFVSQNSRSEKQKPISVQYLNNLVKKWCKDNNIKGNFGSHTLRKTFGYHQRKYAETPLPVLMHVFGHTNQRQTLDYLCIQDEEIQEAFMYEL